MSLGEYVGAGSGTTKLLLHMNGNSNDSSGNGNNGSDVGIYYDKSYGRLNGGALFNGTTSKIEGSSNLGIDGGTITISLMIKLLASPSGEVILFAQQNNNSKIAYQIILDSTQLKFFRTKRGIVNTGFSVNFQTTLNQWYNIGLVYNSSNSTIYGYVNSVLVGSTVVATGNGTGSIGNGWSIQDFIDAYYGARVNSHYDSIIVENIAWDRVQFQKYNTNALGRFATL